MVMFSFESIKVLTQVNKYDILFKYLNEYEVFLDSSAAEHPAVNRRVVGSNPTRGVFLKEKNKGV